MMTPPCEPSPRLSSFFSALSVFRKWIMLEMVAVGHAHIFFTHFPAAPNWANLPTHTEFETRGRRRWRKCVVAIITLGPFLGTPGKNRRMHCMSEFQHWTIGLPAYPSSPHILWGDSTDRFLSYRSVDTAFACARADPPTLKWTWTQDLCIRVRGLWRGLG